MANVACRGQCCSQGHKQTSPFTGRSYQPKRSYFPRICLPKRLASRWSTHWNWLSASSLGHPTPPPSAREYDAVSYAHMRGHGVISGHNFTFMYEVIIFKLAMPTLHDLLVALCCSRDMSPWRRCPCSSGKALFRYCQVERNRKWVFARRLRKQNYRKHAVKNSLEKGCSKTELLCRTQAEPRRHVNRIDYVIKR